MVEAASGATGLPPIDPKVRDLILRMAGENPRRGLPPDQGELLKLGITVSHDYWERAAVPWLTRDVLPRRWCPPGYDRLSPPIVHWNAERRAAAVAPVERRLPRVLRLRGPARMSVAGASAIRRGRRVPAARCPRPRETWRPRARAGVDGRWHDHNRGDLGLGRVRDESE